MKELANNTEYDLLFVLKLIDKCKSLEELRQSIVDILEKKH